MPGQIAHYIAGGIGPGNFDNIGQRRCRARAEITAIGESQGICPNCYWQEDH